MHKEATVHAWWLGCFSSQSLLEELPLYSIWSNSTLATYLNCLINAMLNNISYTYTKKCKFWQIIKKNPTNKNMTEEEDRAIRLPSWSSSTRSTTTQNVFLWTSRGWEPLIFFMKGCIRQLLNNSLRTSVQVWALIITEQESREGHGFFLMTLWKGNIRKLWPCLKAFEAEHKPYLRQPKNNLLNLV